MKNSSRQMNKYVAGLLIIVSCMLSALGMCKTYGMIEKAGIDKEYNYFETNQFQRMLMRYSYCLAYEFMTMSETNASKTPAELLLDTDGIAEEYDEEYEKILIEEFNEDMNTWTNNLTTIYNRNIKYNAIEGTHSVSNDSGLAFDSLNMADYQFVMKLEFDSAGHLTTSNIKGVDGTSFSATGYRNWLESQTDYQLQPIKNMSVVFAVPNELVSGDLLYDNLVDTNTHRYAEAALLVSFVFLGIIFLAGMLLPYSWFHRFGVLRVPAEIWIFVTGFAIFGYACMCEFGVGETILNDSLIIGELVITNNVIMAGNFIAWTAIFIFAFLATIEIKSLFKLGLKRFIRKRTIIGRAYGAMKRGLKQVMASAETIDLRDNNNSYILKLLGVNAIILLIITSLWMVGIPMIIVYSIVLFFIIRKYVDVISSKYRILSEATNQIAEGNLDVTIKEDLGVFNPFKDNLEKIQSGFKKAVDEEVKSQKMKTDLISNVSHDLKTPLTAIITYVDLLRDETLPEEKRKEYVDILDRKSQRLQILIEDLFEMSKATSGTLNLHMEEVDVVALMKQTLVEVGDRLEEADLTVKTNFSSEKIMVSLDSERTYRVFENLLLNASKYAMNHTRVYVEMLEENGYVEISVKNVSAEEIDFTPAEIVERFVRGDRARNTEGSGLGLAIAKSFVELQGGKFKIEIDGDLFKAIIWLKV